jgi:hypothetical protein
VRRKGNGGNKEREKENSAFIVNIQKQNYYEGVSKSFRTGRLEREL